MQKETESRRKKIVKRVAVIFLAALLLLTFFSNTIMNYSLPEVATAYVLGGTVSNKVRVQGNVEMSSDYTVEVSGARVIKEVLIESGDTVKKGQVLFTFEEGENTELEEARQSLDQMELEYAKMLLKIAPDYEEDNAGIKEAKEALQDAVDDQDEAEKNNKKKNAAKKEEKAAAKKVDEQKKKVDKLQEQVDAYAEIGDYDTVAASLAEDRKMLKNLQVQLADLKEDLAAAQQNTEQGEDALLGLQRSIRDKEAEIAEKKADIANREALLKSLEPSIQLKADLKQANKKLASLQEKLEEKTKALAEFEGIMSVEEAKAAVKEKQKALKQAIDALEDKKEQDALTAQTEAMDQKAAKDNIEKQREKVKNLEESNDLAEVKAAEDGMVSTVNCKAGDNVTADMPLAEIQSLNSSFLVNVTVTTAQAALLHVGDEAIVENVWDRELTAKVRSMKANPENPNQSKLVSFEISNNANPGETLQLISGEKTARYDTIVPNNAVKEDSNGHFVLVVTVKGTPLGNRYIIKRVDVEVEASDESNSAVTGALNEYDNVVTNSSKPLENKMQVRLAE